jgi:hypothetical protein
MAGLLGQGELLEEARDAVMEAILWTARALAVTKRLPEPKAAQDASAPALWGEHVSALGALVFGEPEGERMAALLTDGSLVAPVLLNFELASICLKKIKAQELGIVSWFFLCDLCVSVVKSWATGPFALI